MEKISIIVPVYNVEKYLEKCVNSIINQTYRNLEIILIDDGSTDNSGIICDELAKKDSRINVIHKENEGVSVTKNLGIKVSTSDYVAFVDSDDWLTEDYCECLYKNMVETNADVSIVAYNVVREDDSIIANLSIDSNMEQDEIVVYEGQEIIKELLKQKTIKNFVCKLYKKDILCDFPVGVTYEDIVFSFDVLSKAKKVVYTNRSCYNYLKRSGSITATVSEKNLNDFSQAIFNRYKVVKEKYPSLEKYNIYAFLESTLALSIKSVLSGRIYKHVNDNVVKFTNIIKEYMDSHEEELFSLLNDYQKLCIYLMKYNLELYYNFLKERQRLKVSGQIK